MNATGYSEDDYLRLCQRGWSGGKDEGTPCGSGSKMENTASVREWLPEIARKYGFKDIADAGAGDLHWAKSIQWPEGVRYWPYDLVPRQPEVERRDIRVQVLPPMDAIICRLVLGHMQAPDVCRALDRFRQSAQILIATTHHKAHRPEVHSSFNEWNLKIAPFGLGNPIEEIIDHKDYRLALWRIIQ